MGRFRQNFDFLTHPMAVPTSIVLIIQGFQEVLAKIKDALDAMEKYEVE